MDDTVEQTSGEDLASAAAAFTKILAAEPAPKEEAEAAPQIQPQAETQEAPAPETNTDEEAEAPASEEPAVATEAAPQAQQPAKADAAPPTPIPDANAQAVQEVQQALTFARAFLPQLQAQIMGEFQDIKTMDDLARVGEDDPGRYNRFVLAAQKMQGVMANYQHLEKQAKEAQAAASPKIDWAGEAAKLHKAVPELADPQKGPVLERQLNEFAKSKGINPAGKTAAEIQVLYEAYKATTDKASAAKQLEKATEKAKLAPPVQKPGTSKPQNTKGDKALESFQRLQKTGHVDDAAQAFRFILSQ